VLLRIPVDPSGDLGALNPQVQCTSVEARGGSIDTASGRAVLDLRVVLAPPPAAGAAAPPPRSGPAAARRTRRSAVAAPTPASTSSQGSQGKSRLVCCHWRSKGWCRYQDGCKFLHPEHKRGVGRNTGAGTCSSQRLGVEPLSAPAVPVGLSAGSPWSGRGAATHEPQASQSGCSRMAA